MANEQTAGPVDHLITVQCDAASSTLALAQPSVVIKPGDRVIWQFFNMPEGWSPWVEFRPQSNGTGYLGPFTELTQSAVAVWGTCESDPAPAGNFTYRLTIQKGVGAGWDKGAAVISSGAGLLSIGPPATGTTQRFTIAPTADSVPPKLSVSPIGVMVQAGDTVEWDFVDIPEADTPWRPVVSFTHYDGSGKIDNLYLGPFTNLTTGQSQVRGTGNNHVTGTYYFQVSVIRVSDNTILWMGSSDPAIDNRGGVGDPTTTGGTGG